MNEHPLKSAATMAAASSRREFLGYGATAAAATLLTAHVPAFATASHGRPVRETVHGKIRGVAANGVAAFKGISYGQSTAGRNRFRAPQPVRPWAGVRDATRLGHPCIQTNDDLPVWLDPMPGSEDCLVLNVWAPEHAGPSSKLPVMVFIHGGGYTFGSAGAPLYDLGNLARLGDVIAVGVNHRLQAFGFTDLSSVPGGEFAAAGNAGLLDLIAAFAWVRENITAFGGDPENVTAFGQSGGGAKISMLMAMPEAKGLFHRAIIESGSVFRVRERAEAEATSDQMFSILGIRKNDIAALQAVPASLLLKCGDQIMAKARGTGHPSLKYAPVIDGHFLPSRPWDTAAPQGARDIPMLLGTNRDEAIIYLSDAAMHARTYGALGSDAGVAKAAIDSTSSWTPDQARVEAIVPFYRKAMGQVPDMELVLQLGTDLAYWKGMVHQAELQVSSGSSVFSYNCSWRTPCFGAKWAPHGVELPFVMGHRHYGPAWDGKDTDAMRAAADPQNLRFRAGDQMLNAWANFARSGNPSTSDLAWPRYTVDRRQTMIFDAESKVVDDPHGEFRPSMKSV